MCGRPLTLVPMSDQARETIDLTGELLILKEYLVAEK